MPRPSSPDAIHPSLWLASQLARGGARGVASGFDALDAELPSRGWPTGSLVELLLPSAGIGELRLLRPALLSAAAGPGHIALLQAPHEINTPAWVGMGVAARRLLRLRTSNLPDAFWAAEQVLRADSCQALLMWQARQVRLKGDALRRLHMAAQSGGTLFFLLRPLSCADEASPAPLRLALRPAPDGLEIAFLKRRGPRRDGHLFLPLSPSPDLLRHVPVDRRTPATVATRNLAPELAR